WASIDAPNCRQLSSTPIREDYFKDADSALERWADDLSPKFAEFMRRFAETAEYRNVADEAAYVLEYKAKWATAPYPPILVTADAVVVQSGHVLLVERRALPGRGLLALPGGYVGQYERIRDAMLRELKEETRLKV